MGDTAFHVVVLFGALRARGQEVPGGAAEIISLRQSGQVMDGRSSLRSIPLRASPGPKFRVCERLSVCPPSRAVSSPKRDRKKERACYGVCQEDHEIVQDKTGETAGNRQGKSVETIRRAQSQA